MGRLAGAVVAGIVLAGGLTAGPATADTPPARILVVGDSVTQGASGDYTWRYRLWKTLQTRQKAVDFVGPRAELSDGSTAYADPDFDQDHAARWGAFFTVDGWWAGLGYAEDVTKDLVAAYAPDVVIEDLGLNNLTFGAASPAQVIALVEGFVTDVREVRPSASIVLGQLTQQWVPGGAVGTYNAMLLDLADELDRPDARVVVATVPTDYTELGDTYDHSHPNAEGEAKIAAQFADALATLPLPDKPVPRPTYAGAAALSARPRVGSARLDFTVPTGATKQVIWKRDLTRGGRWRTAAVVGPGADHHRVTHLRRHHRYAFKLLAYEGTTASSAFSNVARARAR